jgi:hypothetical protein
MKSGQRIKYQYTHFLNTLSSTEIVKVGEYIGLIKHTARYRRDQLALVHFDGTKGTSKVPLHKLSLLK